MAAFNWNLITHYYPPQFRDEKVIGSVKPIAKLGYYESINMFASDFAANVGGMKLPLLRNLLIRYFNARALNYTKQLGYCLGAVLFLGNRPDSEYINVPFCHSARVFVKTLKKRLESLVGESDDERYSEEDEAFVEYIRLTTFAFDALKTVTVTVKRGAGKKTLASQSRANAQLARFIMDNPTVTGNDILTRNDKQLVNDYNFPRVAKATKLAYARLVLQALRMQPGTTTAQKVTGGFTDGKGKRPSIYVKYEV